MLPSKTESLAANANKIRGEDKLINRKLLHNAPSKRLFSITVTDMALVEHMHGIGINFLVCQTFY